MTTERSKTKLVCDGKCITDVCAIVSAQYGIELRPLNALTSMTTGKARLTLQAEYGKGRSRKTTNIHGDFCAFCGGRTP